MFDNSDTNITADANTILCSSAADTNITADVNTILCSSAAESKRTFDFFFTATSYCFLLLEKDD